MGLFLTNSRGLSGDRLLSRRGFLGRSGFTLMEVLVGTVLTIIVMGMLVYFIGTLFNATAAPSVSYNGDSYESVPSYGEFRNALYLHAALSASVDNADGVIVFGGAGSHPTYDPTGPSSVLDLAFVPTALTAMATADPKSQYSSWSQRAANSAQLAAHMVAAGSPADCSVLTVQGLARITSITQQRRFATTLNGQSVTCYEVIYQEIDWSSGSASLVTNPDSGLTPTYAYRIFYGAAEDQWTMAMGAQHFWFRIDPTWDRVEEGPCTVQFADPYVLAGGNESSALAPISRFVYSLPVVQ